MNVPYEVLYNILMKDADVYKMSEYYDLTELRGFLENICLDIARKSIELKYRLQDENGYCASFDTKKDILFVKHNGKFMDSSKLNINDLLCLTKKLINIANSVHVQRVAKFKDLLLFGRGR